MAEETQNVAELPLDSAGTRLARAREAAGLSRSQVAAQTKIPERHIAAIEAGDFATLPARTYAVGFSRSYARAVGLDEAEIVQTVRDELSTIEPIPPRHALNSFEPGDPARVPSAGFAWVLGLAGLGVIVAGFFLWPSVFSPGASLPSLVQEQDTVPTSQASGATAPAPQPSTGPVVFTAQEAGIWVKFYDGAGNQLLQKELAQGETYTVPTMPGVQLWTARPDALGITVNGQAVPKLSDVQRMMKDVPVDAAALLARGAVPVAVTTTASAQSQSQSRSQPQPRRIVRERDRSPARDAVPASASVLPAVEPAVQAPVAAGPAPAPVNAAADR